MTTQNKFSQSVLILVAVTLLILAIPLTAMQFTEEVQWSVSDFIIAGSLLFGTGFTFIMILEKSSKLTYRVATGLSLFSALFMVWANLAVGLIGNEAEPINLLYFLVLAIGIVGSFIARLKPFAMARVLYIMATGIIAITIYALMVGWHEAPGSSLTEVVGVNALFITLYMISAGFYQITDSSNRELENTH